MKKNIYGIGLPRTGTKSLAKALEILGFNSIHYCLLTTKEESNDNFDEQEAFINNSYYASYKEIFYNDPDGKFILTTRNKDDWQMSVDKFESSEVLPDIEQYIRDVSSFFMSQKKLENFLIVNIIDNNNSWNSICKFLELEIPDIEFPHE